MAEYRLDNEPSPSLSIPIAYNPKKKKEAETEKEKEERINAFSSPIPSVGGLGERIASAHISVTKESIHGEMEDMNRRNEYTNITNGRLSEIEKQVVDMSITENKRKREGKPRRLRRWRGGGVAFQRCWGLNRHGGGVIRELNRKEMGSRAAVTSGYWHGLHATCLLAGDVTAEEAGLDPVNGDQNTVAGCYQS